MPRISRGLIDSAVYHVINRGNGGQEVFHKGKDYEAFIAIMEESVHCQSPYGSPSWQMQVSKELGLESTLRPRGRPEKMG